MPNNKRFVAKNGLQAESTLYISPDGNEQINVSMLDNGVLVANGPTQATSFTSTAIEGVPPLTVTSTTQVSNLNAEYLADIPSTGYAQINAINTSASRSIVNGERVFVSSAAATITLPAEPAVNTCVSIGTSNSTNIVVARNGERIMELEEDLTIDQEYTVVTLLYVGAAKGWRIV